jgi:hypothetical protein
MSEEQGYGYVFNIPYMDQDPDPDPVFPNILIRDLGFHNAIFARKKNSNQYIIK